MLTRMRSLKDKLGVMQIREEKSLKQVKMGAKGEIKLKVKKVAKLGKKSK